MNKMCPYSNRIEFDPAIRITTTFTTTATRKIDTINLKQKTKYIIPLFNHAKGIKIRDKHSRRQNYFLKRKRFSLIDNSPNLKNLKILFYFRKN